MPIKTIWPELLITNHNPQFVDSGLLSRLLLLESVFDLDSEIRRNWFHRLVDMNIVMNKNYSYQWSLQEHREWMLPNFSGMNDSTLPRIFEVVKTLRRPNIPMKLLIQMTTGICLNGCGRSVYLAIMEIWRKTGARKMPVIQSSTMKFIDLVSNNIRLALIT